MYEVLSSEQISEHWIVVDSGEYDLAVPEEIISPDVLRETRGGEGEAVVAESDAEPLEAHVGQSYQQSNRENYLIKTSQCYMTDCY